PDEEARLYVGVPEAQHQTAGWQTLRDAKLIPVTLHAVVGADGRVHYSSVWRKAMPAGFLFTGDDEPTYADRGEADGLPVDVSLTYSPAFVADARTELLAWLTPSPWAGLYRRSLALLPHPERRYAGVFRPDAALGQALVLGLTPEKQIGRCRELASQGYRP